MAVDHYENFPVASLLLPRPLRQPVRDIYRFARSADDIADEGDAPPEARLRQLAAYREALHRIGSSQPVQDSADAPAAVFTPLARTIAQHQLPITPFLDLLSAFQQDVQVQRYPGEAALMDYCARSANPVGRLMLHLYGEHQPDSLQQADAVCTGLQLTNFWQDVAVDWRKGRLYVPLDALHRHGLDETQVGAWSEQAAMPANGTDADGWQALMRRQCEQAATLLRQGLPLTRRLPQRIGLELRMVVHGGLRILERLEALHYDVFRHRPTLSAADWPLLLWRAWR